MTQEYLESTYNKYHEMKTHLMENQANITALLRTTVYFRDMINRTMEAWKISDAIRTYEILTLMSKLPEEDQVFVRTNDF